MFTFLQVKIHDNSTVIVMNTTMLQDGNTLLMQGFYILGIPAFATLYLDFYIFVLYRIVWQSLLSITLIIPEIFNI